MSKKQRRERRVEGTSIAIDLRGARPSQARVHLRKQGLCTPRYTINPFELVFLVESVKRCKSCHLDFCHRKKVIPFDVIFSHKERWMYPINGDWSNCRPSQRETVRYYHASMKCLLTRFPYFTTDYISISSDVKESLRDSHKSYLTNEFGLTFD